MFKEMLGEAIPILEKFSPSVAALLTSHNTPVLVAMSALVLLSRILGVKNSDFVMNDIKNSIVSHPDIETVLKVVEPQIKELLSELDSENNE